MKKHKQANPELDNYSRWLQTDKSITVIGTIEKAYKPKKKATRKNNEKRP